jgi:predicted 3-demethylubiquinone-9 3-methyltransferase (glyoxalase superfamily)
LVNENRLATRKEKGVIGMAGLEKKVRTCLWFEKGGVKAAEFYVSLLADSRIDAVFEHGNAADPMVVEYMLGGAPMMHLTAGPMYKMTPAASISVLTKDQAETDRLWQALLEGGGEESRCGWLADRFGVSWQIVPEKMVLLFHDTDQVAAARARAAMLEMRKIDIAAIEAAFAG